LKKLLAAIDPLPLLSAWLRHACRDSGDHRSPRERERKGPVAKRWEGEGACAAIRCDSPLKLIEQCGSLRFVSFVAAT